MYNNDILLFTKMPKPKSTVPVIIIISAGLFFLNEKT